MSIPKWIVLGWLTFSVISLILNVGKPREPMTPQGVALATWAGRHRGVAGGHRMSLARSPRPPIAVNGYRTWPAEPAQPL